ncbi:MAG: cyclase family protein [Acidobacteriia bacterium]|nr:cyclase family protein [Terriglobia bacterium]
MPQTATKKVPEFNQLPVRADLPADSSWGVFEDGRTALGCLNFLTPEGVVEAAGLVKSGKVFRLDAKIGFAKPPLFGRAKVVHSIAPLGPAAHDDLLDQFNTQEGSQWDGLAHVGHVRTQAFYNGVQVSDIREGGNARLGIHHWADKFVGRGVLIDAFGFRQKQGRPVNPLERDAYSLQELQAALAAQKTELRPGSILLVRTGWMEAYERCTAEEKIAMAPFDKIKSIGIDPSREVVAWLWNHQVAAIATDSPGVEPLPMDLADEGLLHYRALPLLGLPLGELFVLKPLAEDCAQDGRYEFLMVSVPLHLEGGVASPPNAVVIK